jgi:phytoene synthase
VVPTARKLALLARALSGGRADASRLAAPPLAANAYLVAAVAAMARPQWTQARHPALPWWNLPGRATAVIEIFERLARVERSAVRGQ